MVRKDSTYFYFINFSPWAGPAGVSSPETNSDVSRGRLSSALPSKKIFFRLDFFGEKNERLTTACLPPKADKGSSQGKTKSSFSCDSEFFE